MCIYLFAPSRGQPLCFSLWINNSATLGKIKTFQQTNVFNFGLLATTGSCETKKNKLYSFFILEIQIFWHQNEHSMIILFWLFMTTEIQRDRQKISLLDPHPLTPVPRTPWTPKFPLDANTSSSWLPTPGPQPSVGVSGTETDTNALS